MKHVSGLKSGINVLWNILNLYFDFRLEIADSRNVKPMLYNIYKKGIYNVWIGEYTMKDHRIYDLNDSTIL